MAFKILKVAMFVLVPTIAFAQPVQKQACKNDAFSGCVSPKTKNFMNARAEFPDTVQPDHGQYYGDANSMYGWNSSASNAAGRTGGGGAGGGGGGGE